MPACTPWVECSKIIIETTQRCKAKLSSSTSIHLDTSVYHLAFASCLEDAATKTKNKLAASDLKMFAEDERQAAKPGAEIGMTAQQVMNETSWGRFPILNVHRTRDASGTLEQWVYGPGRYLYFRNGMLVSIQN